MLKRQQQLVSAARIYDLATLPPLSELVAQVALSSYVHYSRRDGTCRQRSGQTDELWFE